MTKFTLRKFNGDDAYSWAVFKAQDVKGTRGPVFYGQATPIVSGCSKMEASSHKRSLEEIEKRNEI